MTRRKLLAFGLVILLLLVLGGIGSFLSTDIKYTALRYASTREKVRAAGLYLESSDFSRDYNKNLNIALVKQLSPLFLAAKKIELGNKDFKSIENGFEMIKPHLFRLNNASNLAFPKEFKKGFKVRTVLFPEFNEAKSIVRILVAKADFAVATGDLNLAEYCWTRAYQAANLWAEDKMTFFMLHRLWSNSKILESLRIALEKKQGDAKWIRTIESIITRLNLEISLKSLLNSEHLLSSEYALLILDDPEVYNYAVNAYAIKNNLVSRLYLTESYSIDFYHKFPSDFVQFSSYSKMPQYKEASLVRIHEDYLQALKELPEDMKDFDGIRNVFRIFDKTLDEDGASYSIQSLVPRLDYDWILTMHQMNWVKVSLLKEAIGQVQQRQFDQPALIHRGRLFNDIDGKAFRLKLVKQGLLVYSIGANKKDDGGQAEKPPKEPHEDPAGDYSILIRR